MAARRLPRPDRAAIAAELREIGARLRLSGDNPFRARAYAAGADAVESLSDAQLARRLAAGTLILRGTESDILADGALDYPDDVLDQLDVIIATIHGRYRMTAAAMTARLLTAMRLPVFKIWGHPLGQLVLRRPPIACDVEAVLDALASARGAVEISGDPYRWICRRPGSRPRGRGLKFVISVDAHAIGDLDNLEYGVAMARRGGVQRGEVLNALSFTAFRTAVHP